MKPVVFILLFMAITMPVLVFMNIWQVYQYQVLEDEIAELESIQRDWLEKNKRMIGGISILRSPGRIETLALKELDLEEIDFSRIISVKISD